MSAMKSLARCLLLLSLLRAASARLSIGKGAQESWTHSGEISPAMDYDVVVFRTGDDPKVTEYRIPQLGVGPVNQTLVLLAEARITGKGDDVPKNIVYRFSQDQGRSWSPERILFPSENNYNIYGGSLVVDQVKKSMIYVIPYCVLPCPGGKYNTSNVWTMLQFTSTDDGRTWSAPRNISGMIGTSAFFGPSSGVQKMRSPHKGRLFTCGHHGPQAVDGVWCIASDDHGLTWHQAASIPGLPFNTTKVPGDFLPDENNVVELSDGSLLINARNQNRFHCACRLSLVSRDGGDSLDLADVRVDTNLTEPAIAAGLAMYSDTVLYAGANSTSERKDLVMHWSYDNGLTWNKGLMLWPAGCGYTSLAAPAHFDESSGRRRVFLAYEKGIAAHTIDSINVIAVDLLGGSH